jgi:hypothetical protein
MMIQNWISGLLRRRSQKQPSSISGEESGSDSEHDEPSSWVVLLTLYGDPVTERIVISRLADEGIASRVRRESGGPVIGLGVGLLSRVDILVPEDLEGQAIDILESDTLNNDDDLLTQIDP